MPEVHGIRRYFTNTSWMMASRVCHVLAAFVMSIVMARALHADQYGLLNYALSFVMLFSALGSLGLNDILVRELVDTEKNGREGTILGSALGLRLGGTALMTLLAWAGVLIYSPAPGTLSLVLSICLSYWFLNAAQVLERFYEARVLAKYSSWAQMAATIVSLGTVVGLALSRASLFWFATVKAIESGVLLVILLVFFRRGGGDWHWRFEGRYALHLFREGLPLMMTGLFILVYMRIDQVMLAHYLNTEAIGAYAVAVRLSEAWYFLPSVLAASLFPAILRARHGDPEKYRSGLALLYELMTWLGIAVALPTTLLAHWVIRLLYGPRYVAGASALALYIWAGVFVFQGIARSKWLVGEGLQRYAIAFAGGASLLNIILNAILIPRAGMTGAALATVAACACQTLLIPAFFSPTRPSVVALLRSFIPTGCVAELRAYLRMRNGRA